MFPYVELLGFCILTQELSLIFQQQEAGTKFYKNVIQYSRRSHIKNLNVLNLYQHQNLNQEIGQLNWNCLAHLSQTKAT